MYNQKWFSLNDYPLDYYELLYLYYATCGRSVPATYYSLDLNNSICDKTVLNGGPYQKMGSLSGLLWNKILLLQVYQPDTISLNFSADERGFGKFDQITTVWIPSIYEIRPQIHDYIYFDHIERRENQFKAKQPLYEIINLEKATNAEITFWKLSIKASSYNKLIIDKQLCGNYTFISYEKKIYKTQDAISLAKIADKNHSLQANSFYNENCGLYLGVEK